MITIDPTTAPPIPTYSEGKNGTNICTTDETDNNNPNKIVFDFSMFIILPLQGLH